MNRWNMYTFGIITFLVCPTNAWTKRFVQRTVELHFFCQCAQNEYRLFYSPHMLGIFVHEEKISYDFLFAYVFFASKYSILNILCSYQCGKFQLNWPNWCMKYCNPFFCAHITIRFDCHGSIASSETAIFIDFHVLWRRKKSFKMDMFVCLPSTLLEHKREKKTQSLRE